MISISMSNTKMGCVPSFSLMPIVTCNKSMPCTNKWCYAIKIARLRKTVAKAWRNNTTICQHDLGLFKGQMIGWLSMYQPQAFRIHVGGDFFSVKYLLAWCEIAERFPKVKFFAFTKQYNVLRSISPHYIPKNLSIILSAWLPSESENWLPPKDLRKRFPVAWVINKDGSMADKVAKYLSKKNDVCLGNCETCGLCFKRKKKDGDIVFYKH